MPRYAVAVTRMSTETGRGRVEVPEGQDPHEYVEQRREAGDEFLDWSTDSVNDVKVSVELLDADE